MKFLNERQTEIVDKINEEGSVKVSQLSAVYRVSLETIRRDLEKLESLSLLKKIHGGAISTQLDSSTEIPLQKRSQTNIEEKVKIAEEAAAFIEDGDIVGFDASTTVHQMTKLIQGKQVTVVTNSIPITLDLSTKPGITVLLAGGYVRNESMSLVGSSAEKVIADYHVDKFFFSCTGFDLKRGVSELSEEQAKVKEKFIDISDQLFLLADHSKFQSKSLVKLLGFEELDYLITDSGIGVKDIQSIKAKGTNVVIAK